VGVSEQGWRQIRADRWARAAIPVITVFLSMLVCIGLCTGFPCLTTGARYGMWADTCPVTDKRLDVEVSASGLLRGQEGGGIRISPSARWLDGDDRDASVRQWPLQRGFGWEIELRGADGAAIEGALTLGRARRRSGVWIPAELPADLPDGDYVLAVTVDAGFESTSVEVPIAVYAPAVVHVLTDRPLYKPGQDVLLRAVTLRRTDLMPLELRPGRWRILDPDGVEMLVERGSGDAWGISDGSFPLDASARVGTWTAQWLTGDDSDTVQFEVRPFQLPRFLVETAPHQPWYRVGDEVVVEGTARYTSGAPVAGAPVEVALHATSGRWPLPVAWEAPHEVRTGPDGRFRATFGGVPPDLMDLTRAVASVTVTDETGESAQSSAGVVFSHQSLAIDAVTELGGGLVEGFNNRAYLRVTTPAGLPLANADLVVRRPYDPSTSSGAGDAGKRATTDADGVAALQIDPGPPVTVVEPAPPVRVRPIRARPASLSRAVDGATGGPLVDLAAGRTMDALGPAVTRCGPMAIGDRQVLVGVQIDPYGRVRRVASEDDPLSICVARAVQGATFPAGSERSWQLWWDVPDPGLPSVSWSSSDVFGSTPEVPQLLAAAAMRARSCLPAATGVDGATVLSAHWSVEESSRAVSVSIAEERAHGLPPAAVTCLRAALGGLLLARPAERRALGVSRATLSVPMPPGFVAPQPTTRTAYELAVTASAGGEVLGEGRVVVEVGSVPSLRLRPEPSLLEPGQELAVELIRGPGFYGELPEELHLLDGTRSLAKAPVVDKTATWTVPDGASGFLHVEWGGARAVVFVRRAAPLEVELATDRQSYSPGDRAQLTVTTRAGEAPVAAAVGLVGVDATLAQLAPLVGPDDYGRVTVRATADRPAFGSFDARALALGQIRGEQAAKAAVLAITGLPMDPGGDAPTAGSGHQVADTQTDLSRNFYRALDRARERLRAWEGAAADGQLLEPAEMVRIWRGALGDLRQDGDPAVDGFGRELDLAVLPRELLALTDPRTLVADGARLPEDFVGWTQYVEQEVIR
jgi:hypothetical protein